MTINNIPMIQVQENGVGGYQFLDGLGVLAQFIDPVTGFSRYNTSADIVFSLRLAGADYVQIGVEFDIPASPVLTTHEEEVTTSHCTLSLLLPPHTARHR